MAPRGGGGQLQLLGLCGWCGHRNRSSYAFPLLGVIWRAVLRCWLRVLLAITLIGLDVCFGCTDVRICCELEFLDLLDLETAANRGGPSDFLLSRASNFLGLDTVIMDYHSARETTVPVSFVRVGCLYHHVYMTLLNRCDDN